MSSEGFNTVMQIISAIGVPIITGIIAWITNSLHKTNVRIDTLEKSFHESQLKDKDERAKLATSIARIEAQTKEQSHSLKRIEGWLMNNK